MRLFCNIHETNYDSSVGCPLWGENDWQHKAKHNCLPSEKHPLSKAAINLRDKQSWKSNQQPWKSNKQGNKK